MDLPLTLSSPRQTYLILSQGGSAPLDPGGSLASLPSLLKTSGGTTRSRIVSITCEMEWGDQARPREEKSGLS